MEALDIIPIASAKDYLALDDTSRDSELNRMIKSAVSYVQKRTQHIMVAGSKIYDLENGCVWVYDFPIVTFPPTVTKENKPTYYIVTATDSDAESITLSLGYDALTDVPEDLVEACYLMLKFFFYEQEGNGKVPLAVDEIINHYKRFII